MSAEHELPRNVPPSQEFEGGIKIRPDQLPELRERIANRLRGRHVQIQDALNKALGRYGNARSNLPAFATKAQRLERVEFGSSEWTALSSKLAAALVHENEVLARAIYPFTPLSGIETA